MSGFRKVVSRLDRAEDVVFGKLYQFRALLFVLAITALALYVRLLMVPFVSGDFAIHLQNWLQDIRGMGARHSIGVQVGNYTPMYHYLLALMCYVPGLNNLQVIKYTSIAGDFVLAGMVLVLVYMLTKVQWKAVIAYAAVLALPTVVANSSVWGQCDAMYTAIILLCVCLWVKDKKALAMGAFGLALAVKLQSIFILPALLIFLLCGRLRIRQLLAAPLAYVVAFLPAIIVGGWDWGRLFTAYGMQVDEVLGLAMNVQTLPGFLNGVFDWNLSAFTTGVLVCAIMVLGCIAFYCWNHREKMNRSSELLLLLLMACLVPYIFPAMHDRYFYLAEIGTLVYLFVNSRRWYLPVILQFVAIPNYISFLLYKESPFGDWMVFVLAVPALVVLLDFRKSLSGGSALEKLPKPETKAQKQN